MKTQKILRNVIMVVFALTVFGFAYDVRNFIVNGVNIKWNLLTPLFINLAIASSLITSKERKEENK